MARLLLLLIVLTFGTLAQSLECYVGMGETGGKTKLDCSFKYDEASKTYTNQALKKLYDEKAFNNATGFFDLAHTVTGTEPFIPMYTGHISHRQWKEKDLNDKEWYTAPQYDVCRTISIETPKTVVKKEKDGNKENRDPIKNVFRMCGWKRESEGEKLGSCTDYSMRGATIKSCICNEKPKPDGTLCNDAPGLKPFPKFIITTTFIIYLVVISPQFEEIKSYVL